MRYLDFHRHIPTNSEGVTEIHNIFLQEIGEREPAGFFTCGLHPWHLDSLTIKECFNRLTGALRLPGLVAVGECGLDKNIDTSLELQLEYLRLHLQAARLAAKPLVIHCVRRHGELLHLLKEENFKQTVIIHGFDSKTSVARQLTDHDIILSFGSALLKEQHPAAAVLAMQQAGRYFLETDDDIYSIAQIYQKAAQIRNCTVAQICTETESAANAILNLP